jgi:excisionase family DNA binding protein
VRNIGRGVAAHPEPGAIVTVVTPQEVAAKLGVHVNTVYSMAQRGEIPVAFHVGPRLRFDLDEVLGALKAREDQS